MEIDLKKQQLIESELNRGERLLWSGKPNALRESLSGLVYFVFAIPWTVFSIDFMLKWNHAAGVDIASLLFNGSFILIGFAMLLSPLWIYLKSRRTVYAITDTRILIIQAGRTKTVQSYDETTIGHIERREKANGSGDLIFAQKYTTDSDDIQQKTEIKFVGIPEVHAVEQLLRSTFNRPEAFAVTAS